MRTHMIGAVSTVILATAGPARADEQEPTPAELMAELRKTPLPQLARIDELDLHLEGEAALLGEGAGAGATRAGDPVGVAHVGVALRGPVCDWLAFEGDVEARPADVSGHQRYSVCLPNFHPMRIAVDVQQQRRPRLDAPPELYAARVDGHTVEVGLGMLGLGRGRWTADVLPVSMAFAFVAQDGHPDRASGEAAVQAVHYTRAWDDPELPALAIDVARIDNEGVGIWDGTNSIYTSANATSFVPLAIDGLALPGDSGVVIGGGAGKAWGSLYDGIDLQSARFLRDVELWVGHAAIAAPRHGVELRAERQLLATARDELLLDERATAALSTERWQVSGFGALTRTLRAEGWSRRVATGGVAIAHNRRLRRGVDLVLRGEVARSFYATIDVPSDGAPGWTGLVQAGVAVAGKRTDWISKGLRKITD